MRATTFVAGDVHARCRRSRELFSTAGFAARGNDLTTEFEVLCEDCTLSKGVIRAREDLAIEPRRDRQSIQRGKAEVEAMPGEMQHLVTALGSLHHNHQ